MMGQKLSSIHSAWKSKKKYTMEGNLSDISLVTQNINDDQSNTLKNDQEAVVVANNDCLSNEDEKHQHFEEIYNSNSELTSEYDHIDTANVNIVSSASSSSDFILDNRENEPSADKPDVNIKANKSKTKSRKKSLPETNSSKKKKKQWPLKLNCVRLKTGSSSSNGSESDIPDQNPGTDFCVCTGFRKTENQSNIEDASSSIPNFISKQHLEHFERRQSNPRIQPSTHNDGGIEAAASGTLAEPFIDLSKFNPEDYPIEDCDERARLERAREIAEGVDPPPGFSPNHQNEVVCNADLNLDNLTALFQSALSLSALSQIDVPKSVHTQIDYIHCLVPDLYQITSCSFYWGKMDRYEAERLLANKAEGTFLLRDSAQEEYLFSVSFRKYGRSLHARIEQWNHRFSFDSHDPGVFASNTVCGLIEHYKDPTCCMFFEPMLTIPLPRNFPFSLQHLCRAVICDHLTYDSISYMKLPKTLKTYLKEYHYKQRVRVRKFESEP